MFGLRLGRGLHLGHLVGNLRPALDEVGRRPVYVILADLFTRTSGRDSDVTLDNACGMVAECMALGLDGDNVKYVAQSVAFESVMPLYFVLSCLLPFDKLRSTRPLKRMLEEPGGVCFGEVVFPVAQCAEMISTRSEILFSNTDNLGLVSLTKDLSAKVGRATGVELPKPRLAHGTPKNLRGLDHNKMSVGQGNAIFLSDSPERIRKRVVAIDTARSRELDCDLSLIYEYLSVTGLDSAAIQMLQEEFEDGTVTALQLKNHLADELTVLLGEVQQRKTELYDRPTLLERIRSDTQCVRAVINETTHLVMTRLANGEFYQACCAGTVESGDR